MVGLTIFLILMVVIVMPTFIMVNNMGLVRLMILSSLVTSVLIHLLLFYLQEYIVVPCPHNINH